MRPSLKCRKPNPPHPFLSLSPIISLFTKRFKSTVDLFVRKLFFCIFYTFKAVLLPPSPFLRVPYISGRAEFIHDTVFICFRLCWVFFHTHFSLFLCSTIYWIFTAVEFGPWVRVREVPHIKTFFFFLILTSPLSVYVIYFHTKMPVCLELFWCTVWGVYPVLTCSKWPPSCPHSTY